MRVTSATLRDFRNYADAEVRLGPGLTVIAGPNGAGKTNLLEGVYFGCTGRSPRTSNDRELVRRGEKVARVTVSTEGPDAQRHLIEVGVEPGEQKALRVDGAAVDSLSATPARPLLGVFLPERLELVKGAPSARRAHLDSVVAALWPRAPESAPRTPGRSPSATRCSGASARGRPRRTRWERGTASWPSRGTA